MPKLPVRPSPSLRMPVGGNSPKTVNAIIGLFRMRTAQTVDASAEVAAWMSDPSIVEGLNRATQPIDVDQLRGWIGGFDNVRKSLVMIRTVDGDLPVGFLMFDFEPRHRIGSYHLLIGRREHRRDGAGLAAVRFALKHLFDACGASKVSMEPLSRNSVAVQSCQWLGFRLEGILVSHRLDMKTGDRLDQHVFGMTQDEYRVWPWK